MRLFDKITVEVESASAMGGDYIRFKFVVRTMGKVYGYTKAYELDVFESIFDCVGEDIMKILKETILNAQ